MTILDVSFMQKPLRYLILPLVVFLTSCASANVEQTLVAQNDAVLIMLAGKKIWNIAADTSSR